MGIESDQLVFDYLSRVGDLAQQRQLPSAARMRLVSGLREEIDRRRAKTPVDTPASVRRILNRLGDPTELVTQAGAMTADRTRSDAPPPVGTPVAVPEQRTPETPHAPAPPTEPPGVPVPPADAPGPHPARSDAPGPHPPWSDAPGSHPARSDAPGPPTAPPDATRPATAPPDAPPGHGPRTPADLTKSPGPPKPRGLRRLVPRPRSRTSGPAAPVEGGPGNGVAPRPPSPPHLAGLEELGESAEQQDWWRVETGTGLSDHVPGFVGGIEIPEILKPPPSDDEDEEDGGGTGDEEERPGGPGRRFLRRALALRRSPAKAAAPALEGGSRQLGRALLTGWSNPLLLIAAALLVTGAVIGNPLALGAGWVIAWASRRLSPTESKFAVLWLPGLALSGGVVWLWGRVDGRWGDPVADGQLTTAIEGTWPWVLRGAAFATALYLVWRSQRR
ncbi:hypothetical protein [Streptomyces uncialis]|uniref:hypothetical protein n=1 Tax=Streptomyces uncialis TaxID=1048205 RepID=UPI002251F113|nr:hypothetical protein [Streptomyces uncialis]MCX4660953.1 hypothetical protein [Streptomyces uncialis]